MSECKLSRRIQHWKSTLQKLLIELVIEINNGVKLKEATDGWGGHGCSSRLQKQPLSSLNETLLWKEVFPLSYKISLSSTMSVKAKCCYGFTKTMHILKQHNYSMITSKLELLGSNIFCFKTLRIETTTSEEASRNFRLKCIDE